MALSTKTLAILTFASALGFGVLVVLSEMYLGVGDGLLDGRLIGYDVEAVTKYLGLLSKENLAFYIGPFRVLDSIVPPLLALTFSALIWTLGTPVWRATIILPLVYVLADLRENAIVGKILQSAGRDIDADLVASASDMTQLKWLFTVLSLGVFLWLWRKGRAPL